MRGTFALVALLLVSLAAPLVALYEADSPVIQLTEADFDAKVMETSDALWLIEFYAPWCAPVLATRTHLPAPLHGTLWLHPPPEIMWQRLKRESSLESDPRRSRRHLVASPGAVTHLH
ncbi:hypothetical protein T484DRAFT_1743924 [Baffinella frigidus]|nr:hypothetical protein T484DRAFT_1743924 [Cryptophyta sp. CCMP2293]